MWCMSAIEYNTKQALQIYPQVLGPSDPGKDLFLANVIKSSADAGLIDSERRPLWFGANTIRNRLVHNNGIGNASQTWQFTKDLSITMEDGKPFRGSTMTFPLLTGWITSAYADWCDAFLSKLKP